MLAATISQYLKSNRRLVIPQLGAFLVKEPDHQIVFSALLTRDDGTLRALLTQSGMSEVEANGVIDRVVFDIRFSIENKESFTLEGVGTFSCGQDGKICFKAQTPPVATEPQEAEVAKEKETAKKEAVTEEAMIEEAKGIVAVETAEQTPILEQPQKTATQPSPKQFKFEADPDLEGLSYSTSKRRRARASKIDWWLIIGIAALVLATVAILYGFLREGAGSNSEMFLSQHQQHQAK